MKPNITKSSYKWEVVFLLWIAFFLNQADRQAFNIVLPQIQEQLGASDGTMGFIAMLFNVFYAITVPFAGYFADRKSRSVQITIATLIFSVATLCTGIGSGIFAFVLFRCVGMGMGQGLFGPTYTGLIAQYHDSRTRAKAMSVHQTSYYLGVIVSGFLTGFIAERLGWKYSVFIFGAAGIAVAVVLALRLRDKPAESPVETKDQPGLFASMAAIFKVPTAVCMIIAYTSLIFVLNGYLTWMPKFLKETFELTPSSAGFHSMFWTHAAAFVGVLAAGWLSDRIAAKNTANRLYLQAAGLLLAAPCIAVMGLSSSFVTVCAALAGFGFFRAFFDAGTYAILYDVISPKYYSSSSAVLCLFGFGIGSLAPWILGMLSSSFGLSGGLASLSVVWILASLVLLLARFKYFKKDAEKMRNA